MRKLRPLTGYTLEVTIKAFDKVQSQFDCFVRSDVSNEIVLDASSFDGDVNAKLAGILNIPEDEFAPGYFLLYCEGAENWSDIE